MIKDIIKFSWVLLIITAIAAGSLSFVNSITKDKIAVINIKNKKEAITFVLKNLQFDYEKPRVIKLKDGSDLNVWEGKNSQGAVEGYAFVTSKYGYSSSVQSIVGIDKSGNILGIKILDQKETPGLGTRVEEVASKDTFWTMILGKSKAATPEESIPWFQKQYIGLTITKPLGVEKGVGEWINRPDTDKQNLKTANMVTALSGATITTRAVTDSINNVAKEILPLLNK